MTARRCALEAHETPVMLGWRPGYRPSNGTEGAWFEQAHCSNCDREHENHGPHGVVGPGCPLLMSTMAGVNAYPNPGPPEWFATYRRDGYDARCSLFEPCQPCAEDHEAERLKVWPVEVGTGLTPRRVTHCTGQMSLID